MKDYDDWVDDGAWRFFKEHERQIRDLLDAAFRAGVMTGIDRANELIGIPDDDPDKY